MNDFNLYWLLAFSILLLTLNILYSLIIKYVNDKPLGHQSLYDTVLRYSICIPFMHVSASMWCLWKEFTLVVISKVSSSKTYMQVMIWLLGFRDNLSIVQLYGTTYCFLAIVSRFDSVSELVRDNLILGNIVCLFYSFTFTAACINLGCMCIIRYQYFKQFFMSTVPESVTYNCSEYRLITG